ncbi:hypothetical protein ACFL1H_07585 [Nanoarchaeota archaeon]
MIKMDQAMLNFRDNIDAWVKDIRDEMNELSVIPAVVGENLDNIQKHEETIQDLRQEIRDLKQEMQVLKLVQLKDLFEGKLDQKEVEKLTQKQ